MSSSVTADELRDGLQRLGLQQRSIVSHVSLRSFGDLEGGAEVFIDVLEKMCPNVLMPGFSFVSNAPPPPADAQLRNNGTDYSFYENWCKPLIPFEIAVAEVDVKIGMVAQAFSRRNNVLRSEHAWHSWSACGPQSRILTDGHSWDTANLPLEKAADLGFQILLIGVGLSSCTALHVAEERAGRKPFVRWAVDPNGEIRRVRAAGCARGFDKLFPELSGLFKITKIGKAKVMTAPLNELISQATEIIKVDPNLTRCSTDCIRCEHAISGGPSV